MSTVDCGGGGGTGFQPLPVVDRLEQVRRHPGAAVGERRHVHRHRHRRHRHLRPGRCRPRSSRRRTTSPSFARCFHSVDGTSPCTSFGRSMPLFTPRPSSVAHLLILSTPDHVADGVEVDVARLLDRVAQIDRAVATLASSTRSAGRRRWHARGTCTLEVGRDDAFLECGQRDRHLEGRAGRIASLDGAVLQRTMLVGVERRPRGAVDAGGERVRVVRRDGS